MKRWATWLAFLVLLMPVLLPAFVLAWILRGIYWVLMIGIEEIVIPDLRRLWRWITRAP